MSDSLVKKFVHSFVKLFFPVNPVLCFPKLPEFTLACFLRQPSLNDSIVLKQKKNVCWNDCSLNNGLLVNFQTVHLRQTGLMDMMSSNWSLAS